MTLYIFASIEMKFSVFANEMLLYVQNPKNLWKKKSHRTNWVQQDHRYKVKIKPIVYLYISNEYVGEKN